MKIPKSHPIQPLKDGQAAIAKCTCGHCGLSWDDGKVTSLTPVPGARCPFEAFHVYENEKFPVAFVPSLTQSQELALGSLLVGVLKLKKKRGMFQTEWGAKSEVGLARLVVNLVDEAISIGGGRKA